MVPVSFTGTLPEALATDESPFHLSRVRYSGPEPTLVEPFSNGNRLVVSGVAVTTMSASGFTGTLNGSLDLYDHKWSPLAACSSSSHVFTLVRT